MRLTKRAAKQVQSFINDLGLLEGPDYVVSAMRAQLESWLKEGI